MESDILRQHSLALSHWLPQNTFKPHSSSPHSSDKKRLPAYQRTPRPHDALNQPELDHSHQGFWTKNELTPTRLLIPSRERNNTIFSCDYEFYTSQLLFYKTIFNSKIWSFIIFLATIGCLSVTNITNVSSFIYYFLWLRFICQAIICHC